MELFTESPLIAGDVPRRTLRTMLAVSAAAAAVFAAIQVLPADAAAPPFGNEASIDSEDTLSPSAILDNEAIFELHAWELITKAGSAG